MIRLYEAEKKMSMLKSSKNLKLLENETSTPIYVAIDRTQKQREAHRKLVEELKSRKRNGEKDLVIRNDKIMPFRDTAQNSWAFIVKNQQ